MADEFRFVARWFSNYNGIWAQMNSRTKRAIYEWIALETDQTYDGQICENNSEFW